MADTNGGMQQPPYDDEIQGRRMQLNTRLIALENKYIHAHGVNASVADLFASLNLTFQNHNNCIRFNGESPNNHNLKEIDVAYTHAIEEVSALMHAFHALGDINEQEWVGSTRVLETLERVGNTISYTRQFLNAFHLRNEQLLDSSFTTLQNDETVYKERMNLMARLAIMNRDMFKSSKPLKSFQKTLFTVLHQCMDLNLRVSNDNLYAPKTVTGAKLEFDENGEKICYHCRRPESAHSTPTVRGSQRDDHVFTPLYRETDSTHETMAFVCQCTIKEFVDQCTAGQGMELRRISTENSGITKQVAEYIRDNSALPECPRLYPNRHTFAFRNGLLRIWEGRHSLPHFYPYFCTCRGDEDCDGSVCGWGRVPQVVATKYFNVWYDNVKIRKELWGEARRCGKCNKLFANFEKDDYPFQGIPFGNLRYTEDQRCAYCDKTWEEHDHEECEEFFPYTLHKDAYNHIRMPWVDSIFEKQDITGDVRKWVKILLGRLLFDINHLDGWQVMIFIKGVGGSGKSKLVYHVNKCFTVDQIGRLQSESQKQFVLGDLYQGGKSLIVSCPECDENMTMARTDFLSIVAGDGCMVTVKGGTSIPIDKWTAPCIMAGNALPVRKDTSDAEARRIMMIDHPNPVQFVDKDTKLDQRMDQDHAAYLTACAGLYLNYAYVHGAQDIWGICPDYFNAQKKKVRQNSNVLASFLSQSELLIRHEEAYITKTAFVESLKDFASENGFQTRGIRFTDDDFFRVTFSQYHLKFVQTRKAYPPQGPTSKRKFIVGVGLREYFAHLDPEEQPVNNHAAHLQIILENIRDDNILNAIQSLLHGDALDELREMRQL